MKIITAARACAVAAGLLVVSAPVTALAQDTTTTATGPATTATPTTVTTVAAPADGAPASESTATTDPTTPDDALASESTITTDPTIPDPTDPTVATSESPTPSDEPTADSTMSAGPAVPTTASSSSSEPKVSSAEETFEPAVEQEVTVTITSPVDGATVEAGEPIDVTGTVTIGLLGTGVSVVYVVDTSGSTSGDAGDCNGDGVEDAGDDLNGDGAEGEIIDCEIAGVEELESQLADINGAIETGLVSFTSGYTIETGFGSPGRTELDDAVSDLDSGGGTDFDSALSGMNTLFDDAVDGNRKIGYLFTDGRAHVSEGTGSPLQDAIDAGIVVNTFSVGAGAVGCEPTSPLTTIANATGGQCIQVDDPADLTAVLEGLRPAGIEKVEVSVNGGPPVEADVDLLGNFEVTVTGIVVGPNKIVATATTTDQQTASDEVTVNAADTEAVVETPPTPEAAPAAAPAGTTRAPAAAAQPVSASGALPYTGSDSLPIASIGSALLLAGAALTLGAARRARRTS